ncbi:MAG TPA: SEL1-like repeat protein [Verrucomicrobiae bacterium]|nr:SEL1-like repeat protein [Verrucomicrobiae bacterium]
MTAKVSFQAVTRLRLPLLLLVALFCLRESFAATARFKGFPSRQQVVLVAVPNPPAEIKEKLPPPIAPGIDSSKVASPHAIDIEKHAAPAPPGIEIEKNAPAVVIEAPKIESTPAFDPDAERKARIKADRERLNRNAVIWQQERAAGGSASAQRSLAMRYFTGDGLPKDEIKGMDLLRKAAAGGDSAAQKELAKREPAKKE